MIGGGRRGDIAWLVMVERATVRFRGRNDIVRWELRVTEVFERLEDTWHHVHRHADPLVERHELGDVLSFVDDGRALP